MPTLRASLQTSLHDVLRSSDPPTAPFTPNNVSRLSAEVAKPVQTGDLGLSDSVGVHRRRGLFHGGWSSHGLQETLPVHHWSQRGRLSDGHDRSCAREDPEETRMWEPAIYTLSFPLPQAYQDKPPQPTNDKLYFTEMPDMDVYVRSYGGWMLSVTSRLQAHQLTKELNRVGPLTTTATTTVSATTGMQPYKES
ncbi:hypothetical protein WMY93_005792 [Mugilogobius chulae]|uniref:Uncharacterized protein n=1 Tax=Mugilogobius chulae TaxID=88201 RepID=A0AAW0PKR8_9GOBI